MPLWLMIVLVVAGFLILISVLACAVTCIIMSHKSRLTRKERYRDS